MCRRRSQLLRLVSQSFNAMMWGVRAGIERKIEQIPHSTFGYVQDDKFIASHPLTLLSAYSGSRAGC
jgi:hypothetical protein